MNYQSGLSPPMQVKATPYAHQIAAYEFALQQSATALLMEMGCGKTITAIAIAGSLYLDDKVRRCLVVAPLSIVGVWDEEFAKFAGFDYTLAVLTGTLAKKTDTLRHLIGSPLQVAVVNYESAWRLEREIMAWQPDIIICDEGHKIKNHSTSAAKAMHRLGAKSRFRLLLTGTPVTNKAIDIFSQYKFLNPAIFGNSFYSWRNRYFDMVGYGNHTPIMKRSMESELTQKMHSIAFRATKAECLDLPETTDIIRTVELEPKAAKLYRGLVKDSYAELGDGEITATNILTRLLRLSQLTGGYIGADAPSRCGSSKPEQVSTAKLDALADIIEEAMAENRKIVIIARFTAEIEAICKLLQSMAFRYSRIDGSIKDRAEQVSNFQNDSEVMAFVGQISTCGLGITLTSSSVMVFYSMNYSSSDFEQCKARIHRSGQTHPCSYYYIQARNTVDEKVLLALQKKADLAKSLVDDARQGRNPFE